MTLACWVVAGILTAAMALHFVAHGPDRGWVQLLEPGEVGLLLLGLPLLCAWSMVGLAERRRDDGAERRVPEEPE